MSPIKFHDFDFSEVVDFEVFKKLCISKKPKSLSNFEKAYEFAKLKHQGQKRMNGGEDYIIHPLTVATYCLRLDLDETSIIAAFLHDTVEDTDTTLPEIEKTFGFYVAYLVDGLTNITEVSDMASSSDDIKNVRKIILKSADDIRVIMIKLCDRMHNFLTMDGFTEEKKLRSAGKVKNMWEPLAEYVGLNKFKRKFQDIRFSITDPENYKLSAATIEKYVVENQEDFQELLGILNRKLGNVGLSNLKIEYRVKSVASFYEKFKNFKSRMFEKSDVSITKDIFACRVLVDDTQDCYVALGIVHSNFEYVPAEYDDYIVRPKPSGYRSVHTAIKYKNLFVEIQFKTFAMHDFNEYGPASHFAYKEKSTRGEDYYWVKELKESQEREDNKIKLFSESVFVFTPKGRVIRVQNGSTPIDFAYCVHSTIGNEYIGAKVNGKIVDMQYILKTGDVCEILTQSSSKAKRDWLKYARMSKTKHQIRRGLSNNVV